MSETVNHPSHYGGEDNPYETIKVLRAWLTPQGFAGFLEGNALKYRSRHRFKGRGEDLRKAEWYEKALSEYIAEVGYDAIYGAKS